MGTKGLRVDTTESQICVARLVLLPDVEASALALFFSSTKRCLFMNSSRQSYWSIPPSSRDRQVPHLALKMVFQIVSSLATFRKRRHKVPASTTDRTSQKEKMWRMISSGRELKFPFIESSRKPLP
jgi:hypothetical protein